MEEAVVFVMVVSFFSAIIGLCAFWYARLVPRGKLEDQFMSQIRWWVIWAVSSFVFLVTFFAYFGRT